MLDNRLRLNGAVYYMKRDNTQFTNFDASVAGATFALNGANSETIGVESDFTMLLGDHLTLNGAFSYNEAELKGDTFTLGGTLLGSDGTALPYAPKFQGNIGGRYDWTVGGVDLFARGIVRHTGSSFTTFNEAVREKQENYTIGDLGFGVDRGNWWAELYVNNVWDERAELFIESEFLGGRILTNRPRTIGLRISYRMN